MEDLLAAGKAACKAMEKEQLLAVDTLGDTALIWAALKGDAHIVEALLAAAGKAVKKDQLLASSNVGDTALIWRCRPICWLWWWWQQTQ